MNYNHLREKHQAKLNAHFGRQHYKLIDKVYKGDRDKSCRIKCECGNIFQGQSRLLLAGTKRCLLCYPSQHNQNHTHTTKDNYQAKLDEALGHSEYILLDYKGNGTPVDIKHRCGIITHTTPQNIRTTNIKCPCLHKHMSDINLHREALRARFVLKKIAAGKTDYKLIGKYRGIRYKNKFLHDCGRTVWAYPNKLLNGSNNCICVDTNYRTIKLIQHGDYFFRCQGHEPFSLNILLDKYEPKDIISGGSYDKLIITFKYNGRLKRYRPDFYIPKANLIVETKSLATMGLAKSHFYENEDLLAITQAKARACIRQGYRFRLHLFDGPKRIKLPKDWYTMSKAKLLANIRG